MPRSVQIVGIVFVMAALSGCGAIFNGSRQNITVTSAPDAAQIKGEPSIGDFTTPTTLNLERKHDYTLTFAKDGYSSATAAISHHARGGIIVLDVLLTGLIGVVIDAATGAWNKLEPATVTVAMTKLAEVPGPDEIKITVSERDGRVGIESTEPGVIGLIEQR